MATEIIKHAQIEAQPKYGDPTALIRETLASDLEPQAKAQIIAEFVKLQQDSVRFTWESEERQAKIDFDNALNLCQSKIGRIAPNQSRNDTHSKWADYAQVDRAVRPIYTEAGFSIAYSEEKPINPAKVRIKATLARGGVSKEYFAEITPSTTGAKGNALVNATDADAIAQSRAKRYLLLDIFNIAVGIDAIEKQGIPEEEQRMPEADLLTWFDALEQAPDDKSHASIFLEAHKASKARADHLDIDLRAIQTGTKEGAKKVFGLVYAKWRDDNDADALKAVTAEWEKRKAGPK